MPSRMYHCSVWCCFCFQYSSLNFPFPDFIWFFFSPFLSLCLHIQFFFMSHCCFVVLSFVCNEVYFLTICNNDYYSFCCHYFAAFFTIWTIKFYKNKIYECWRVSHSPASLNFKRLNAINRLRVYKLFQRNMYSEPNVKITEIFKWRYLFQGGRKNKPKNFGYHKIETKQFTSATFKIGTNHIDFSRFTRFFVVAFNFKWHWFFVDFFALFNTLILINPIRIHLAYYLS